MRIKRFEYQTRLIKEPSYEQKSTALIVIHALFSNMAKTRMINKDLDVMFVLRRLSKRTERIKNTMNNFGSDSGSWRATLSDSWLSNLVTALQNLDGSKIIGLVSHPQNQRNLKPLNTWPWMVPISIKMAVW